MRIKDVLINSIKILKEKDISEPNLKAKLLLSFVLNKSKEYLVINDNIDLKKNELKQYYKFLERLINNEPLQYILGTQEFMGLKFIVNENVLIPRADTEILVEEVIIKAENIPNCKILDLCTGSGAIAISLKKNLNSNTIVGSDICKKALETAKENAKRNEIELDFIQSDLFGNINDKYDIIVCNPPYIESKVIRTLDEEVQKEPLIALDGGKDGLDFYKRIIKDGYKYLKKDGYLCLEVGYNQKDKVIEIINESNKYKEIYSKKDLYGNDRIVICQKNIN